MSLTPPQRARLAQLVADKARSGGRPAIAPRGPSRGAMVLAAASHALPPSRHGAQAMVSVAGKPMIDTVIDRLGAIGVQEISSTPITRRSHRDPSQGVRSTHLFSREERSWKPAAASRRPCRCCVRTLLCHQRARSSGSTARPTPWSASPSLERRRYGRPAPAAAHHLAIDYDGPGDFFIDQVGRIRRRRDWRWRRSSYAGIQILHPRLFADAPTRLLAQLLYDRRSRPGRLSASA